MTCAAEGKIPGPRVLAVLIRLQRDKRVIVHDRSVFELELNTVTNNLQG